jgi:hypothetical protein
MGTRFCWTSMCKGLLVLASVVALWGQGKPAGEPLRMTFLGMPVTVSVPARTEDETFSADASTLCVGEEQKKQCYTQPDGAGLSPKVSIVALDHKTPVLLFTAVAGSMTSQRTNVALLQLDPEGRLRQLLPDVGHSEQGQFELWSEPSLSPALLFVKADYVWGPDEPRGERHRYRISTYEAWNFNEDTYPKNYHLMDEYMTVRSYSFDLDEPVSVLTAERSEIIARLTRVMASRKASQN